MGRLGNWLKSLDHYWFGRGSPTTIGLFRMIMSSLIFINLAMILIDFDAWFGQDGFVPNWVGDAYFGAIQGRGWAGTPLQFDFFTTHHWVVPRINVFSYVLDDRVTLAIYLLIMLAALLSAFGLWTRLATIVMAIGIVSLHHRNGLILHGGDTVMRISALYIAIAPSGRACSLDRLIGLWKGRIAPGPVRVSVWVQRVLAYNVALIYFTTFWEKFGMGSHWKDLTATWYPARLNEFARFPVPHFVNELPMVYVTTFLTLATELALGTFVFYRPARKWVLLAGVMLHATIDYSMNIPLFSFLMVTLYLAFYDGEEVEGWAQRLGLRLARWKASVRLPQGMRFRTGPEAAILATDALGLVDYLPGSSPTWLAESRGRAVDPFRVSRSRSVGAWIIAIVPGLWRRLLNRALETSGAEPLAEPKLKVKPRS